METALRNLKGFVYAFILFLLLTVISGVLLRLTPMPEAWSVYYLLIAISVSCLFLGIYFGNYKGRKGFLFGALYSILFLFIILAIHTIAFSVDTFNGLSMAKFIISIIFGSVGGMIGVNMRA
ncbi:MAG: TIGR04086 family membrane protein [Anaerovoracaceae bacterium]|jgi:putative membrane protein (TIGR04086 family)